MLLKVALNTLEQTNKVKCAKEGQHFHSLTELLYRTFPQGRI